jgi:hypothetical protein
MIASRTASETWSQILSGCPSLTDSDVNCVNAIFVDTSCSAAHFERGVVVANIVQSPEIS